MAEFFAQNDFTVDFLSVYNARTTPSEYPNLTYHYLHKTSDRKCSRWRRLLIGLFSFPDIYIRESRTMVRYFNEHLSGNDYDVIVTSTPPHTLQCAAYRIHRMKNIPLICDLRDPWRENHRIRYKSPLHKFCALRWEKIIIQSAAGVVFNTEEGYELFKAAHPEFPPEKGITIPNGYNEKFFADAVRLDAAARAKKPVRIVYAGGSYDGKVLRFLNRLAGRAPEREIKLEIDVYGISPETSPRDAKGVLYGGKVPPEKLAQKLVEADYLFLFMPQLRDTPAFSLKAYAYARSGVPVVYVGQRNMTFDFLNRYSKVRHFSENEIDGCLDWFVSEPHPSFIGIPDENVLACAWDERFRKLQSFIGKVVD
ncbi:MAG: glycosyltransferase [Victivallaceae bacterium]|nr:glycosyltransferase [Victivallaceae bacterium]